MRQRKQFRISLTGAQSGAVDLFTLNESSMYQNNDNTMTAYVIVFGYTATGCGGTARCSVSSGFANWFWYGLSEASNFIYEIQSPNISLSTVGTSSSLIIRANFNYSTTMVSAFLDYTEHP